MVFLGKELSERRNYSEKVAGLIDKEVSKFIQEAEKRARKILLKRKKLLEKIAKVLIKKETIEREEFEILVGKRKAKIKRVKKIKSSKNILKKEKSIRVKVKNL